MAQAHKPGIAETEQLLPLAREKFVSLTEQLFGGYAKIDAALAHTFRLAGEMVETADEIGLEPQIGQALFADLTRCADSIVLSRQQFLKVHRRAHKIRQSTTVGWEGCPFFFDGEPPVTATAPTPLRSVA